jgi:fructokinase
MAEAGDGAAKAALARYEDRLARALAAAIDILDPDVVVLGGGMSNARRLYRNLPAMIAAHAFTDSLETPILPPAHGDSSVVRGAAWLWPEQSREAP